MFLRRSLFALLALACLLCCPLPQIRFEWATSTGSLHVGSFLPPVSDEALECGALCGDSNCGVSGAHRDPPSPPSSLSQLRLSLSWGNSLVQPAVAAELVQVQVLSRHGNRSPNMLVKYLCPPEKANVKKYGVPPAALTVRGLKQLQQLGAYMRKLYVIDQPFICDDFAIPANSTCVSTASSTLTRFETESHLYRKNIAFQDPDRQQQQQQQQQQHQSSPPLPPSAHDNSTETCTARKQRSLLARLSITSDTHTFLPDIHVRSSEGSRCMESALATVLGLYPDALDYGSPIPIHYAPIAFDHFLEIRHAGCRLRWKSDNRHFKDHGSVEFANADPEAVRIMSRVCRTDLMHIENATSHHIHLVRAIKEISDAFIFDDLEAMTLVGNMTQEELSIIHGFAHRMLRVRYFDKLDKVTYWCGEIPNFMLATMKAAIKKVPGTKRLYTYHGHRENLYAFAELLHLELSDIGIPKTAILPAATLFFELYRRDETEQQAWESALILEQEKRATKRQYASRGSALPEDSEEDSQQPQPDDDDGDVEGDGVGEDFLNFDKLSPEERRKFGDDGAGVGVERQYFIRAYFWRPCPPDNTQCRPFRKQIRIHDCEMDCPYAQVKLRVHRHVAKTGSWQTLCNFPDNSDMYRNSIIDSFGQWEHKTVPYFSRKWWALQKLRTENAWAENVAKSSKLQYLLEQC